MTAEMTDECKQALQQAVSLLKGSERSGQVQMAGAVENVFRAGGKLMVQAGTGTGKSLGYLIPAMLHSLQGNTVVISTATLALQHQIIDKDAPLAAQAVEQIMGVKPRVEVLKGWQNYVCLHKLNGGYAGADDDLFSSLPFSHREDFYASSEPKFKDSSYSAQTKRLYQWAHQTQTGDRDEAPKGVSAQIWRQVSLSSRECLGEKCPFRGECFQVSARAKAGHAQVVVTNHAMLGIEVTGGQSPLPDFDALIIDEAHDLVDRVRSQATVELSEAMLQNVSKLATRLGLEGAEELRQQSEILQNVLQTLPEQRFEQMPEGVEQVRALSVAALKASLRSLAGNEDDPAKAAAEQVALARGALTNLLETLEALVASRVADGSLVMWLSRGSEGNEEPRLHAAPLEVSNRLNDYLWAGRGVVATSATLCLGGDFRHMLHGIGFDLSAPEPLCLDVGTPFEPSKQGILYVAADVPAPGRGEHGTEFWQRMVELVQASAGGVLGLFSSRSMAQRGAEILKERTDFPVMLQGEDSTAKLVQEMRGNARACLMGTLSLWQGVDLPGQVCRLVIIDRIPFPVPTDPLVAARSAAVRQAGRNDFLEVSLTHAALLLAQGAGRLLRSAQDRGVVAVLDSRLAKKSYGRFLLKSMPAFWLTTDTAQVLRSLGNLREELAVWENLSTE